MKEHIEKLLKEKIGTSYIYDDSRGLKVIKLKNYGRGILIVFDDGKEEKKNTQIIYPSMKYFMITVEQGQPNYDDIFVSSVKMMIEFRKKEENVKR